MRRARNFVLHKQIDAIRRAFRRGSRSSDRLDTRAAYRLWAPTYQTETATSFLDEMLAQEMLVGLPSTYLLDAGCGIGRRIANKPDAMGLDLSPEMLAAGGVSNVLVGDVRAMPFPDGHFNMVWCRLVLGHIPDPDRAYRELARVCAPGGYVFVTDFHVDAAAAGHTRSFTDKAGSVHAIEHYVHHDHIELARETGLSLVTQRDGAVGDSVRDFYESGIGLKAWQRDQGLNIVAAFLFRRGPIAPSSIL